MKKTISRIVEKAYYRCFPDRVNDHEYAQMQPFIVKVNQYNSCDFIAEERLPEEYLSSEMRERAKEQIIMRIGKQLSDLVEFTYESDPCMRCCVIRGRLKVFTDKIRRGEQ